MKPVKKIPKIILFCYLRFVSEPGCPVAKLLKIDLRSPAPGCSDRVAPLLNLFYMVSRMCLTNFMLLRDLSRFLP